MKCKCAYSIYQLKLFLYSKYPYVVSIGAIRRPDPKDELEDEVAQVISKNPAKTIEEEDEEGDFSEYNLTDEDDATKKKMDIQMKMLERRRTRKSTKKVQHL